MDLNNREIATIAILVGFLLITLVASKDKPALLKSFRNVIRAFLAPKIVIAFSLFFCYSAALLYAGYRFAIWDWPLLKDSIIEVIFVGFPSVFVAVSANSEKDIFKNVFLTEVGIAAVLSIYLNLECFGLIEEIVLQLLILVISFIQFAAERNGRPKLQTIAGILLAIIGIGALILTTHQLYENIGNHNWAYEGKAALLTVWYPFLLLPFLYILAYWSAIETMLTRMRIRKGSVSPLIKTILLLSFGPRIRYLKHFDATWADKLSNCENKRDVWRLSKQYKIDLKNRMRLEREKADMIRKGAGQNGFSPDGIWLDRTSLKDIKKALNLIDNHQQVFWMRNGYYRDDINELIEACTPKACKGGYYVSPSRDEWACWMINPTGFTLGIGSTGGSFPSKQYEGNTAPNVEEHHLDEFTDDVETCINWKFNDSVDETLI